MRHLKTYENLKEPNCGDYVILNMSHETKPEEVKNFLNNNIGKIINIVHSKYIGSTYYISYNVSEKLKNISHGLYKNMRKNIQI